MSMWKKAVPMIAVGLIAGLFTVLCLFLSAAGYINGSLHGFDLDAEENLIIGTSKNLLVYSDGERIRTIHLHPAMEYDYRFVIQDNTILVGSQKWRTSKVYDLEGSFLFNSDLKYENIREIAESRTVLELNGNVYSMKQYMGFAPAEILLNGEIVYRQPLWDFLLSGFPVVCIRVVLLGLFAVSFVAFVKDKDVQAYLYSIKDGGPR